MYHSKGQALQFLLNASIVFISSSLSSKSNTCRDINSHQDAQLEDEAYLERFAGEGTT